MQRIWPIFILLLFSLPTQAGREMYFLHNDHLGTPRVITDKNQQVVWKGHGKPFGETAVEIEAITNHRRFPGQRFDIESRLHYNYFRDYDPKTGRYIQSDPRGIQTDLSDPQRQVAAQIGVVSSNLEFTNELNHIYGYSGNNPLMNVDPTGEFYVALAVFYYFNVGDWISDPQGNLWGTPGLQDNRCTLGPALGPIGDTCFLRKCQRHDACYASNQCTASSWFSSALGGTKVCNQCNSQFFRKTL